MPLIRVNTTRIIATGLLLVAPLTVIAQQNGGAPSLQQILMAQYPPATATPDGTDLVAAGTVVVLEKDNMAMRAVMDNAVQVNGHGVPSVAVSNTYVNGVIKQTGLSGFLAKMILNGPGATTQTDNRRFNTGAKFWVIKIQTGSDEVVFTLLSDPIDGQRYHGLLKFPMAKGSNVPPEQTLATVAEVLKNDTEPQQPEEPAPTAPAPEQTKTISLGQSKAQVSAMFGEPTRIAKMGAKEIDFYPDMRVTFMNNQVVDVNTSTK